LLRVNRVDQGAVLGFALCAARRGARSARTTKAGALRGRRLACPLVFMGGQLSHGFNGIYTGNGRSFHGQVAAKGRILTIWQSREKSVVDGLPATDIVSPL
jgi:hypothetical protein